MSLTASQFRAAQVCTIIVRSFVVRDATDVAGVKLQVAKAAPWLR